MNQHWHWQTDDRGAYLTCSLLSNWQHGFFTQAFYPLTPESLTSILQPNTTAHRVKQVHGNVVLTPAEISQILESATSDRKFADADAVLSDRSQQSVWAASADCTPILIGDLVTGQVCAVHAGWRGTAKKIVSQAIARFLAAGSQLADLRIAIGPAISGKMYQVDDYVALEVVRTVVNDADLAPKTVLQELKTWTNSPILEDKVPGKVRLDVPRINQIQLQQLGLNDTQIAIASYCTFQASDRFFSYRRTGEKKVQWSGIVSQ
ncbi:MAG: peptidoglycan editing factor PgeF [Cyanobacteria bacterium J06623_7]